MAHTLSHETLVHERSKWIQVFCDNCSQHFVYNYFGIRNRIKQLQAKGYHITTEVSGRAVSCAAMLWFLGDTRIAHNTDIIMMHKAFVSSNWGKVEEPKEPHKTNLRHMNNIVRQDLLDVLKDTDLVNTMLDGKDHWYRGQEILMNNLCTEYIIL